VYFWPLKAVFQPSGTPSWLEISTDSSKKGFHFEVKSVRIGPFQQRRRWRQDCTTPVGLYMFTGTNGQSGDKTATARLSDKKRYAWKARSYVVPSASRKGFQWKASALRGLQRLNKKEIKGPVTIVVPALYNFMPAEAIALGWLNEIDALGAIRHRIADVTKLT
jgi:hypothetical protein